MVYVGARDLYNRTYQAAQNAQDLATRGFTQEQAIQAAAGEAKISTEAIEAQLAKGVASSNPQSYGYSPGKATAEGQNLVPASKTIVPNSGGQVRTAYKVGTPKELAEQAYRQRSMQLYNEIKKIRAAERTGQDVALALFKKQNPTATVTAKDGVISIEKVTPAVLSNNTNYFYPNIKAVYDKTIPEKIRSDIKQAYESLTNYKIKVPAQINWQSGKITQYKQLYEILPPVEGNSTNMFFNFGKGVYEELRQNPEKAALTAGSLFLLSGGLKLAGYGLKAAPAAARTVVRILEPTAAGLLLGTYAKSTYEKIKESENPYYTSGGILSTEVLPAIGGSYLGIKFFDKTEGFFRTIGKEKVPIEEITVPEVIQGKKTFPTAPTTSHIEKFKSPKYRLPGKEDILGVYHAAPQTFEKKMVIQTGTSELPGLYTSPSLSPYFLKAGDESKLFGTQIIPEGAPTALYIYPKGLSKVPKGNMQDFLMNKAVKGKAYVPGIKTEIEAIIPPETELQRVNSQFFSEWKGTRFPIYEYEPVGAKKISGSKITTAGELSESYARSKKAILNPLSLAVSSSLRSSKQAGTYYLTSSYNAETSSGSALSSSSQIRRSYRPSSSRTEYTPSYGKSSGSSKLSGSSYFGSNIDYFGSSSGSSRTSGGKYRLSYTPSGGSYKVPPYTPPYNPPSKRKGYSKKLTTMANSEKSYDVYVREGEKRTDRFKRVASRLPYNKALRTGSDIVDKFIEASFRIQRNRQKAIVEDDITTPDLRKYRRPYGKTKLPKDTYVEKRKYRIDTEGEKEQLSYFKMLKERQRQLQNSIIRRKQAINSIAVKKTKAQTINYLSSKKQKAISMINSFIKRQKTKKTNGGWL